MITVFTSNQPRHIHLINRLSELDSVCAFVQKFDRVHSDIDDPIMDEYFERMRLVEKLFFTETEIKAHTVTFVQTLDESLKRVCPLAFTSDLVVVFGSSWIRGRLYDMIKEKAINIHMGIGYRGASCNAHAIYEGKRHLVGATIQELSEGLDCGDPLFYAYGDTSLKDNFAFGMSAVQNAIDRLCLYIKNGYISVDPPKDTFTAYKRKSDFTTQIAEAIL